MLTRLVARNFKRFDEIDVELGNPVVLTGPNDSGKTSAMQALALWDIGVKRWNEKRSGTTASRIRSGVTINRRDLTAIPHPAASLLWHDLRVRDVRSVDGSRRTDNVRIDIVVEGIDAGKAWTCGLEFDFANSESIYCRPLRLEKGRQPKRMLVPHEAGQVRIAFLPPMSGLASTETRLDQGAVSVRIGEGRTAEVLRNLCFRVLEKSPERWRSLNERIKELFAVELEEPRYVEERGEITMGYRERGHALDLSSSGRGLQQTLLIVAYMYANPGAVVLLDEPDAHLEILRQRQTYRLISEVAFENGNQIVAASHSEVLLNEAAGRDLVIAFVGRPHRIGGQDNEVLKALAEIGFEQYYQAEQTGWVLYLEGSNDLAILHAFARRLGRNDAVQALERPFVCYVGNNTHQARRHFHGLREAQPDLTGVAIFDRIDKKVQGDPHLPLLQWQRREIENYFCSEATLEAYARATAIDSDPMPLFAPSEIETRVAAMREAILEVSGALEVLGKGSPWSPDIKASDDFLTPLFKAYFARLGLPNIMSKGSFHQLVNCVPPDEIDVEVSEKLDAIVEAANSAKPIG